MNSFTVTTAQQNHFIRLAIEYTDDQGTLETAYSNATDMVPSPENLAPEPAPVE